jgi:peptide/nickel transport system substrate-binding protein
MSQLRNRNFGAGARVLVLLSAVALVASACGTSTSSATKKTFVFGTQVDAGGGGCDATQIFQIAITLNCPSAVEEGLVRFNYQKNAVDPALATSWKENIQGSTDTITFNLRQGVKFTDGTPFNADAVVFNLRRVFDKNFAANALGKFPYTNYVPYQSVQKIDDKTVSVTVDAQPHVIWTFSTFPAYMQSPTAVQKEGADYIFKPVGTGPYTVKSYTDKQKYDLVRNPDYWGTKPAPDEIVVIIDSNAQTLVNDLLSGSIDAMFSPPIPQIDQITGAGDKIGSYPALLYFYMFMNNTKSPFNDVRVRQAANYAVDKGAVTKLAKGYGSPMYAAWFPGAYAYNPDVPQYKYDPAKAGQLLDEAGWTLPAGQTVRQKNGQQLAVKLYHKNAGGIQEINRPLVISGLQAVGFKVETVAIDPAIYHTDKGVANPNNPQNIEDSGQDTAFPDPSDYLHRFTTEAIPPGEINEGFYSNPTYDALYAKSVTELDPAKRVDELKQLQLIARTDAPMIWMDQANSVVAYNPKKVTVVPVLFNTQVDIFGIQMP